MNVLYVYDGDWPQNATRIAKQTRSLAEAGHRVRLISRNRIRGPRREENAWMTVERLPCISWPRINRWINYPVFVNPVWVWSLWRSARAARAHCIIVRDLALAPAAWLVARVLGIPFHYDMAEVYPIAIRSRFPQDTGLFWQLVRFCRLAEVVERFILHRAATTFVVSEESRARCLVLGVEPESVVLVGNTPANVDALQTVPPLPADLVPWAGRPLILFVGNLFADRGLTHAVDAMGIVAREIHDAALVIVGDGPERLRIEQQVDELRLHDHVVMLGWKPHELHPAYYPRVQLGLLPFVATGHICITLANKLFDYMGAGIPVIASDVPPMRRILSETRGGIVFPSGNPNALAAAIVEMFRDQPRRVELGRNGRRAALSRYRWSVDVQGFVSAIERSCRRRCEKTPHRSSEKHGALR